MNQGALQQQHQRSLDDPESFWGEAAMTAGRDHDWRQLVARAQPAAPVPVEATDPLYILYTSGTTGQPKGDVQVLGEDGHPRKAGKIGALVVRLPLPPGAFGTLWHAHERFTEAYLREYPGYYKTADAGLIDEDGYVHIMARTDDIINVAAHRLSTGEMEEVLATHPAVAECAVTGVADALKGQVPLGLVVLKAGVETEPAQVVAEVIQLVRQEIGPVASFKTAVVVERLPKTRSGKILRGTIRKIADGEPYKMPATIDDPQILEEIATALASVGYPREES